MLHAEIILCICSEMHRFPLFPIYCVLAVGMYIPIYDIFTVTKRFSANICCKFMQQKVKWRCALKQFVSYQSTSHTDTVLNSTTTASWPSSTHDWKVGKVIRCPGSHFMLQMFICALYVNFLHSMVSPTLLQTQQRSFTQNLFCDYL